MNIQLDSNTLVVMIGASGSGKSTLAEKVFGKDKIVSTDECRRLLAGDLPSAELQRFSEGAFAMFYAWIRARLRMGMPTVADSTALRSKYRNELSRVAEEENAKTVFLFVDTPIEECLLRNAQRRKDKVPDEVIRRQFAQLHSSRPLMQKEGALFTVRPGEDVTLSFAGAEGLCIEATAIDVVGDVHGCFKELIELVEKLGYMKGYWTENPEQELYKHPRGNKLVFVGDLIDRGPEPYKALDFVRRHVDAGLAELVLANHERKFRSYLSGRKVTLTALQKTLDSIPPDVDRDILKDFLYSLKPYRQWYAPGGQEWIITHAAYKPEFGGKVDREVEEYCAYGPVRSVDPVTHIPDRIAWWESYQPGPQVVYGHIATDDGNPRVINGTYGIDTACVHGGYLTALRLPTKEFVQVKAKKVYSVNLFSKSVAI